RPPALERGVNLFFEANAHRLVEQVGPREGGPVRRAAALPGLRERSIGSAAPAGGPSATRCRLTSDALALHQIDSPMRPFEWCASARPRPTIPEAERDSTPIDTGNVRALVFALAVTLARQRSNVGAAL